MHLLDKAEANLTKDKVRHLGFNIPIDDRDRRQIVRSMSTHRHPKLPRHGEDRPEHEACEYGLFSASDPLGGVVSQAKQRGSDQDYEYPCARASAE